MLRRAGEEKEWREPTRTIVAQSRINEREGVVEPWGRLQVAVVKVAWKRKGGTVRDVVHQPLERCTIWGSGDARKIDERANSRMSEDTKNRKKRKVVIE